jgi:hypothetical protein
MSRGGAYCTYVEKRNEYRILMRKPAGRRPFGRPRIGLENIKVDFTEIGWECLDWIDVAEDRDKWRCL